MVFVHLRYVCVCVCVFEDALFGGVFFEGLWGPPMLTSLVG